MLLHQAASQVSVPLSDGPEDLDVLPPGRLSCRRSCVDLHPRLAEPVRRGLRKRRQQCVVRGVRQGDVEALVVLGGGPSGHRRVLHGAELFEVCQVGRSVSDRRALDDLRLEDQTEVADLPHAPLGLSKGPYQVVALLSGREHHRANARFAHEQALERQLVHGLSHRRAGDPQQAGQLPLRRQAYARPKRAVLEPPLHLSRHRFRHGARPRRQCRPIDFHLLRHRPSP